jgi:diaminohydroxyphosphoribosylaminopyrimidine deaminase/5-amino-6-(5-phosphoribosylamino)uracil reductase
MEIEKDEAWMEQALVEARRGVGLTSPNPAVGSVIVRDGVLLGKGWHTGAGHLHAEREAIADVLKAHSPEVLKGSTIYVTLEPCSTYGRTPPCTQGILDAGILRVVYGAEDPNPNHAGAARKVLESAGVQVTTGVLEEACEFLIRGFSKKQKTGLPWIILKSAISLDGRITRPLGESQWLTSKKSREIVQRLRFEADAILTGGNTVRIDNPALTLRSASLPVKPQPWRMVVTRGKREDLPQNHQLFTDEYSNRTLIAEHGDLHAAIQTLANLECNSVLVEAGGTLMKAMLQAGLADEVAIFYAPLLTGGGDVGFPSLSDTISLSRPRFSQVGDDILLRAFVEYPKDMTFLH